MTKTCIDCQAELGRKNLSGRCKRCVLARNNEDPSFHAKRVAAIRRRFEDPDVRARAAADITAKAKAARKDPEFMARLRARGHMMVANHLFTPEARAKFLATREAAGRKRHETVMAWCPPEYREEYFFLVRSKRQHANTARATIKRRIEADRIKALATYDNLLSAQDYLRRFTAVIRKGDGWLYGTTILTGEELISRALLKGWSVPEPMRRAA